MKSRLKLVWLVLLAISTSSPWCAADQGTLSDRVRGQLGVKMVNLSAAVDLYVSMYDDAAQMSSDALLKAATTPDPRLLAPEFKDYVIKVGVQKPYAVLLLCSKNERRAHMEDAGCSARLDRQVMDNQPCEFALKVGVGCDIQGQDLE